MAGLEPASFRLEFGCLVQLGDMREVPGLPAGPGLRSRAGSLALSDFRCGGQPRISVSVWPRLLIVGRRG